MIVSALTWAVVGSQQTAPQPPAPVEELLAEARTKADSIQSYLASEEAFEAAQEKRLAQAAGVVACIGQALVEHPQRSATQVDGAALRDAALAVAGAESLDAARAAFKRLQSALAGKARGEKPSANWNELIDFYAMMEEVNTRNGALNRVVRNLRRGRRPKPDDVRHASTVALLARVIEASAGDYADDAESAAVWRKHASELRRSMTDLATAIRNRDGAKATPLFLQAARSCNDCHKAFDVQLGE